MEWPGSFVDSILGQVQTLTLDLPPFAPCPSLLQFCGEDMARKWTTDVLHFRHHASVQILRCRTLPEAHARFASDRNDKRFGQNILLHFKLCPRQVVSRKDPNRPARQ